MSVLETPRILFRGQIAWDPIVTNNVSKYYNENTSEPVYPTATDKVAEFRKAAIASVDPNNGGLWNPQGTHRSSFFDTAISGADLGKGVVQDDKFVGSPVRFLGMLVDLEPYGTNSSQLFFDAMTFGIDGGYRIAAPRTTRMIARYVNFTRNPVGYRAGHASVIWQTSFAKADGLTVDAFDSKALRALKKALEHDDVLGLTVQLNAYRTIYYNTPDIATDSAKLQKLADELIANLNGGGFQPNPARSMMVGVVGLWRKGEAVHEPSGRAMIGPTGNSVATAHARLTRDSITLDLSNSISETGLDLVKKDLGELTVVAVPKSGKPIRLGSIKYPQYDTSAYLRTSGIVTIPVKAKVPPSANLELRDSKDNVLLTESALRAIPVTPNLYVNQGETRTIELQVYDRGVPAKAGVEVTMCVMSGDGNTVESTFKLVTDANGMVSFPLTGVMGGITLYVPLPGPDPVRPSPAAGIDPQVNTFMYVRTLPADEEIAILPATWDNVYSRVLANWHAMAPCMDNWLDLGNASQVYSFGALIQKLTDEAAFEHYRFMPVTRDMTAGERALLYNFLNRQPPQPVAAEAMLASAAPEDAAAAPTSFADLNRAMRSG